MSKGIVMDLGSGDSLALLMKNLGSSTMTLGFVLSPVADLTRPIFSDGCRYDKSELTSPDTSSCSILLSSILCTL